MIWSRSIFGAWGRLASQDHEQHKQINLCSHLVEQMYEEREGVMKSQGNDQHSDPSMGTYTGTEFVSRRVAEVE